MRVEKRGRKSIRRGRKSQVAGLKLTDDSPPCPFLASRLPGDLANRQVRASPSPKSAGLGLATCDLRLATSSNW